MFQYLDCYTVSFAATGLYDELLSAQRERDRGTVYARFEVMNGLTVHQASMSDAKFRLCVVQGVFLRLKILNSIAYLASLFPMLHADSENGTQHRP